MKTKGDFKEMPKYSPYAFFHKDHFDIVIKARVDDTYKVNKQTGSKDNEIIFEIVFKSKKQKSYRHEIIYIKDILLPEGLKADAKIAVSARYDTDKIGTEAGGTTVVRYGDIPPEP